MDSLEFTLKWLENCNETESPLAQGLPDTSVSPSPGGGLTTSLPRPQQKNSHLHGIFLGHSVGQAPQGWRCYQWNRPIVHRLTWAHLMPVWVFIYDIGGFKTGAILR